MLERVQECLRSGAWHPHSEQSNMTIEAQLRTPPRWASDVQRSNRKIRHEYMCGGRGGGNERSRWLGSRPACTELLEPLRGSHFHGVFNDSLRPVDLMVLGDSVAYQWLTTLVGAASSTPSLAHVRFATGDPALSKLLYPYNMRIIPHSVTGCLHLLRNIQWPRPAGAARRVLIVSLGPHYNLAPHCTMPYAKEACRAMAVDVARGAAPHLDDANPTNCTFGPAMQRAPVSIYWGPCLELQMLMSQDPVRDFVRGIATFVKAAAQWSAENPASSILWMETAPQHFGEPNDDPVGDSKYGYTNGVRCGRLPRVPIPAYSAWSPEAKRMCPTVHHMSDLANATLGCHQQLGNWHNELARPLLEAAKVPIVPMADALRDLGGLHIQSKPPHSSLADCTHWCEHSEATLHVAMAVFNVLRAVLTGS